MDGVAHPLPARSRIPVDIEVVADEGRQPLVHPGNRVGVVARYLAGPRTHLRAPLPTADVKQHHVPWTGLHTGLLLPSFEVRASDWHAGLDPFSAFQLRDIVQDGARKDAVSPIHHAALLASSLRRNVVLHGDAVVHLAVLEEVTPGIHVRHGLSVEADLVVVGRASVSDPVRDPVEDAIRANIGRHHLRLGRRERHDDPALDQFHGTQDFLRRNEVRGALVVVGSPFPPGFVVLPPLLVLSPHRRSVHRSSWSRSLRRSPGLAVRAQLESADHSGKDQPDT